MENEMKEIVVKSTPEVFDCALFAAKGTERDKRERGSKRRNEEKKRRGN